MLLKIIIIIINNNAYSSKNVKYFRRLMWYFLKVIYSHLWVERWLEEFIKEWLSVTLKRVGGSRWLWMSKCWEKWIDIILDGREIDVLGLTYRKWGHHWQKWVGVWQKWMTWGLIEYNVKFNCPLYKPLKLENGISALFPGRGWH